jgi:predicted permease
MAPNLHQALLRIKALFSRKRLDNDMLEELDFHQAMLRERLLREGVPQAEVDAATRRAFGSSLRWHERLRELWQFRTLESLARDVSFSARLLRKSPGFTAVALLTLALGVGANTTIFSMINGLLLRPLPVPQSDRLVVLGIHQGGPGPDYSFPEPFFRSLERRPGAFANLFAFNQAKVEVKSSGGTEHVPGQLVSGEFFPALQTAPLLGRTLTPTDDRPGGNPDGFALVISEGFWQRWFHRSPDVLGSKLQIDNTLFTVVGVMPKRFIGADPLQRPELFLPLSTEPVINGANSLTAAGGQASWLVVMGRLQPDATLQAANAQLSAASPAVLRETVPDANWIAAREKQHFHFAAEPGSAGFTYARLFYRRPLVAVFAMCGGILLLACLNLASLLMARGAARSRELATRLAMGATRMQLMQQLLVESLLIAVMGTAAGLAIAPLVSNSLAALLLGGWHDTSINTALDLRVFAFAALAAVAITLLIGIVPALQATSGSLNEHIKRGQHATPALERRKILPRALMSAEVALALTLVVGAGLLASSLVRLYNSGTGFEPRGIQNIAFSMDKQQLKGDALLRFYQDLGEGLSRQPGVTNVSFARIVPMSHFVWDDDFYATEGKSHDIHENSVGPDYFQTMRIPMLEGRSFRWNDTAATGPKIILNQSAARLFFPGRSPLGQILKKRDDDNVISYEVIGVVGDAKYEEMRDPAPPSAYFSMTQHDNQHSPSYTAVVRIDGPASPLAAAARSLAIRTAPGIPAPVMTSMSAVIDDSLGAERMMALLSVFFAVCALLVTAIGLYGTLAYATSRRTSEIGIRMALGARREQVVTMIFRENAEIALTGSLLGVIAALLAARALASFLYGTSAHDPWVFAASLIALAAVASAASLLPALRAARIEPITAIRCE